MAFSSDLAKLVADQLTRFVTLNRHQLARQVANLDFWMEQVRNALGVIDGYGVRFVKLSTTQDHFFKVQGTSETQIGPDFVARQVERRARRVPERELQDSRRNLVNAAMAFLDRCKNDHFLSAEQFDEFNKRLSADQA